MNAPITTVDEHAALRARLDALPMSRTQSLAVGITCALSALDGYDVLSVTFAAPGISREWNIGKDALGLALSAGLAGMALGSLTLAPLADRFGRRKLVIACLAIMTLGMILTAFTSSVEQLAACRIFTGVGIGAMVPVITPLSAEYANARRRTLAIAIMALGYPIGGTVGGLFAAVLLAWFSWPAVFLLGAGFALLLFPAVLRWLPEPPSFLLERQDANSLPRLNAYFARCGVPGLERLPERGERPAAGGYREIFAAEQLGTTLRITAVNLLYIMTVYYMLSWMPQMVADAGSSPSAATAVAALAALVGVASQLAVGLAGGRSGGRMLVPGVMIGAGATTALFGLTPPSLVMLALAAALAGAFLYAGISGLYAAIVDSFEPRMRSTGVGFVMGVGRAAGAIAPALAGWMFALGATRGLVSVVFSLGALAAGLLLLGRRRPVNPTASPGRL